jgi:hypothetical protein
MSVTLAGLLIFLPVFVVAGAAAFHPNSCS